MGDHGVKEHNHGIDLLRIILAFMVITIHIHANGTGQVLNYTTVQPWKLFASIITLLCYPAVNTYILITGFYSYSAKKDLSNIIKSLSILWLSALFFSLVGYFVGLSYGNAFDFIDFIKRFFPITRGVWWFYTVYFALMLLSPYINKMIDSLDVIGHKILLIILLLILSILPVFVDWKGQIGSNYGYSLIWFITLYISGAYLNRRKVLDNRKKTVLKSMIAFVIVTLALLIFPKVLSYLGLSVTFSMYNSIFVYVQAISLFIGFSNMSIPSLLKKPISKLSGLALASYLLHCQEDIEKILWIKANPSIYANSTSIILYIAVMGLGIFVIGIVLEFIRKNICRVLRIDQGFSTLMSSIYEKFEKFLKREEVL